MIIIKIQGGLCNQLFQWAFGYSLSRKFGVKVHYDINFFQHENYLDERVDVRDFCLPNLLNTEIPLLSQDIINQFQSKPQQLINEPDDFLDFEYDPNLSYYFVGYWQNEKYIKDYREEIISLIDFKLDHNFDFANSCSIHVRRGDYLNVSFAHPIPDISYYKKSIEKLDHKHNIYIFSDDIDWCKKNFDFENMIFMEGNSNIEDLKLMSLCENNIIANSSFSWMAAWLNQNKNKKIICPKKWFGEGMNESNIRPKEWIQL